MIEIRNFTKKYGNRTLFNDFSLKFNEFGLYTILGKSGCGKSTLLNCLSTLDQDYEGEIIYKNYYLKTLNLNEIQELRMNKFGFIFQSFNLFENETVFNNIKLVQNNENKNLKESQNNEIYELLKKLNIYEIEDQLVKYLSGGEKQRVAIARALIKHPEVIFCDEPTGSLDDKNSDLIFEILQEISKDTLVIVVTHDKDRAKQFSNFIIDINKATLLENKRIKDKKINKINVINKGKISFGYIFRNIKSNMKSRKLRYVISNMMFSLSLICLGLTIYVSDNISRGINNAFSNLISSNSLILKKLGDTSPPKLTSLDENNVKELVYKYKDDILYYGTKFLINYKEFFPERNNFYFEKNQILHNFYPLTIRNINDFIYINEDFLASEKFYPTTSTLLNDDEFILSLSYQNMEKICLELRIERSFDSLGDYIKNKGLKFILKTRNDRRDYLDEQVFKLKAVFAAPSVEIYHTNPLFNQKVFIDYMHFPVSYDIYSKHDLPWIMNQIFYIKTKKFPYKLLSKIQVDDDYSNLIFEADNSHFSPNICVEDELCYSNRLFILHSKNDIFKTSIINKIKTIDKRFNNYYFSTPGGYMNYGGSLFNGFSKELYFSAKITPLNDLENAFQKIEIYKYNEAVIDDTVARGYALDTSENNVRFSSNIDGEYVGSKEFMPNNVAISSGLAKKLSSSNLLNKDINLMLNYETKSDNKYYYKKFKKIKLKVIGIVENKSLKIYQNKEFSISLFRDLFQISSLELIPDSIVYEFDKKPCKNDIKKVNDKLNDYELIDPFESVDTSMNEIFKYFDIGLIIFTIFTSISTLLLMFVVNAINFEDDKKDIAIYQMLGFKNSEINKTQLFKNFSYTLPALISSTITLIFISYFLGKALRKSIGLDFGFSFPLYSILGTIILTILMTFISYFLVIRHIKKTKLTNELHKMT